ncbi:MAG: hypothetical protein WC860_07045 [Candidatus Margulisiibacteriota bacterium]|jgi:hypothetical protein
MNKDVKIQLILNKLNNFEVLKSDTGSLADHDYFTGKADNLESELNYLQSDTLES